MSGSFKVALIAGAIGGVLLAVINLVLGGTSIGAIFGMFLIGFAVVTLIAFIIAKLVGGRRDEYEYEDD